MTRDELLKFKAQTYDLWYHCDNKKQKKHYKKVLQLIDYLMELKICIKSISQIGVSHI